MKKPAASPRNPGPSARVGVASPPEPGTQRAARAARSVYGAIVLAAVLVVAGLLAAQLDTLLVAVMITVIISLPLSWCAERLMRLGVPRPLGALVGLLCGLAVTAGLVVLLAPTLTSQAQTLINATPGLVHSVELKLSRLVGTPPGRLAQQLQHDATAFVRQPSQLVGPIASIGLSAVTVVAGLIAAVITAYFIAAWPDQLIRGALSLFPPSARGDAHRTLQRIRGAWLGWMRGVGISMLLIAVLLYLALGVGVGLPFALTFSVLSGIAEIVPYLGALASGIPPVAYALTISPTTAAEVLAIYIAVHQVEANLISPLVMSRSVHLHPAVIAFGVVAVGEVFGFIGLLIAVPILSLVGILIDELWVQRRQAR
ncbi:MAG TPA: AI-2E family transporter [Solirubrobacteraceae bacterium]|nr:AI-2E family transporter [Solirubrobacteraceae bacterium]